MKIMQKTKRCVSQKKKNLKSLIHPQDARVYLLLYLFIFHVFLLLYLKLLVCKGIERNWSWQAIRDETWRGRLVATESRLRAIVGCVCIIKRAISETEIVCVFTRVQLCAPMGNLTDCWSFGKRAIVTTSVGRSFVPVSAHYRLWSENNRGSRAL